jgi:radical SAM superfamily enzyme YgiQ (UPF0313 family)
MYTQPQKKFKPKAQQEIVEDLKRCAQSLAGVRRVFLADGDAMALSFERLKDILLAIKEYLPTVSRVSSYCLPRNLKNKSVEELAELKRLGLSLLYIGAESGNDQILSKIDKGETFQTTVDALHKIKGAAIKSSVMIINGMGGINYTEQHAFDSARLVNETQPDYLATLVLFFHQGEEDFISAFGDDFVMASQRQLIQEMEQFITNLELEQTIFRSDHASNYLVLKGVLNRDKEKLLSMINSALSLDNHIPLRSESSRGL